MPPSDTSTGSLNRSEIVGRRRVELAAGLRIRREQRRVRERGRGAGDDRARRRGRRARGGASRSRELRSRRRHAVRDAATQQPEHREPGELGGVVRLARGRRCCRRPRRATTTRRGTPRAPRPRAASRGSAPGARRRRGTRPRPRCRTIQGAGPRARAARRRIRGAARAPRRRSARARGSARIQRSASCVSCCGEAASSPIAARIAGVRSGIAGAGATRVERWSCAADAAKSRHAAQVSRWVSITACSTPGSSPSRRAEMRDGCECSSYRVSRLRGLRSSTSIVGRSGRSHAPVARGPRRRPDFAPAGDPSQPGRRLALGAASRR